MEDEVHFLVECPLYLQYRYELFEQCNIHIENFRNLSKLDKFIAIMENRNEDIILNLGKYVYNSFMKRSISETQV